uniref:(northern house mosquito) hypothetical protein n=1 Tax=Culex pipiens TaxID=7175 RepID=A0A8D8KE98_CULPI
MFLLQCRVPLRLSTQSGRRFFQNLSRLRLLLGLANRNCRRVSAVLHIRHLPLFGRLLAAHWNHRVYIQKDTSARFALLRSVNRPSDLRSHGNRLTRLADP